MKTLDRNKAMMLRVEVPMHRHISEGLMDQHIDEIFIACYISMLRLELLFFISFYIRPQNRDYYVAILDQLQYKFNLVI